MMTQGISFKEKQLQFKRVRDAFDEKEKTVKQYFTDAGLPYKGFSLFIRAFKVERTVEAWVKTSGNTYKLLATFPFCTTSGQLGPKRKEGDRTTLSVDFANQGFRFHTRMK